MESKKKLTKEDIDRYREKLTDPVYVKNAVGKIADDWADKICRANLGINGEIAVAEKQIKGELKMKNKAIDMHNILFEQLERLNDENIEGEKLTQELRRAETMSKVAAQIINNGRLVVDAIRLSEEYHDIELPDMLMTKQKKLEAPPVRKLK